MSNIMEDLAIQRTRLAEERTTLAYIRTGLSILLAGLFFVGHFQTGLYYYVGLVSIAIGLIFLFYGFKENEKYRLFMDNILKFNKKRKNGPAEI